MEKVQSSEIFKKLFQEVWSSTIPRVKIYYTPHRKLNTCIIYGSDEARFFLSIRDCVNWAARNKLINSNQAAAVLESAEAEAQTIESLEDKRIDAADSLYQLNQSINESDGDFRTIARILRKFRDKWAW